MRRTKGNKYKFKKAVLFGCHAHAMGAFKSLIRTFYLTDYDLTHY